MSTPPPHAPKTPRRKAREDALQILYQLDLNQGLTPEAGLYHYENHFTRQPAPAEGIDPFTQRLVTGVMRHLKELDATIEEASDNWRMGRMPAVDRNILRLGAFELQHCDDIPATVTINEMIEVAKQFGAESSPSFINGILDKLKSTVTRPGKVP